MSSDSEPEKYSIEEMMERLNQRPEEDPLKDGELVTRADGSQAIKVRKRKRRSLQPHKEELRQTRRSRIIQVSGALILVLLAAICAGAGIIYGNSAPFRNHLIKQISANSGAAVELEQFRMNPTHANAGRLILTWPEGNVMRDLSIRGIKAAIHPTSFLGKSMIGEEVIGGEGTLTLQVPVPGSPARAAAKPADPPSIRFIRYTIPKLHVVVGDPAAPLMHLRGTEGAFQTREAGERPQLLLNRGDITIPGWPKLRMDRSYIEFRDGELDVVGMRLRHETDNRGAFELSGTVTPYAADLPSTLDLRLESYLLVGLLGDDFGRLFSGGDNPSRVAGRVDTVPTPDSNRLSFTPALEPDAKLVATIRNSLTSHIELSGFAFLSQLARMLDDPWFGHPEFESDANGVLRRENGGVALENLDLENKGRMFVRGHVAMSSQRSLSGKLEIGIAEGMIKAAANRRLDALFGPPKEGYRQIVLDISGAAANPTDNFMKLFDAVAVGEPSSPGGGVPTFEDLTTPE